MGGYRDDQTKVPRAVVASERRVLQSGCIVRVHCTGSSTLRPSQLSPACLHSAKKGERNRRSCADRSSQLPCTHSHSPLFPLPGKVIVAAANSSHCSECIRSSNLSRVHRNSQVGIVITPPPPQFTKEDTKAWGGETFCLR